MKLKFMFKKEELETFKKICDIFGLEFNENWSLNRMIAILIIGLLICMLSFLLVHSINAFILICIFKFDFTFFKAFFFSVGMNLLTTSLNKIFWKIVGGTK